MKILNSIALLTIAGSGMTESGRRFSWRVAEARGLQGYGSGWRWTAGASSSGKKRRYSVRVANKNGKKSSNDPFVFSSILLPQRKRRRRREAGPSVGLGLGAGDLTESDPPIELLTETPAAVQREFFVRLPLQALSEELRTARENYESRHRLRQQLFFALVQKFQRQQLFFALVQKFKQDHLRRLSEKRCHQHEAKLQGLDDKSRKERKSQLSKWRRSLMAYTGHFYTKMNSALRNGGTDEAEVEETVDNAILAMKAGLRWDGLGLLKVCKNNAILYRGSGDIRRPNLRAGSTFWDEAFFSTSLALNTAVVYLRDKRKTYDDSSKRESKIYLFKIIRHSNGIDVQKFSKNKHEGEVLFAPRTMFRVLEVKQNHRIEELSVTYVVMEEME